MYRIITTIDEYGNEKFLVQEQMQLLGVRWWSTYSEYHHMADAELEVTFPTEEKARDWIAARTKVDNYKPRVIDI